jgi:hypothetical protein
MAEFRRFRAACFRVAQHLPSRTYFPPLLQNCTSERAGANLARACFSGRFTWKLMVAEAEGVSS